MAVERIQVALEPTSQSILTNTTNIKTDTADMKPRVADIQTKTTSIKTSVETTQNYIGVPTESASNGTSGSVHKKLNWMLSKIVPKSVLKVSGTDASYGGGTMPIGNGTMYPVLNTNGMNGYLTAYGSGRLLFIQKHPDSGAVAIVIDDKPFWLSNEGVFDISFGSKLQVHYGGSYPPKLIYYELNE